MEAEVIAPWLFILISKSEDKTPMDQRICPAELHIAGGDSRDCSSRR